uniref:Alpha-1,4-N-acetylglucosaminyltransferase n=1 Tax=Lygus hesperus TaxID=30085 RepID=A0A0K8S422_LYGHE
MNKKRGHPKMRRIITLKTAAITILLVFQISLILKYLDEFLVIHWKDEATEMRRSKDLVVPNIVHFIRFGNATLTFIDAVCILAALKNQKPSELLIHSDQKEFDGGKYWRVVIEHPSARGVVKVKYLPQPEDIYGQPFSKPWGLYHKSDVERLRILMKYGGIYCDNDLYIVSSLNRFRYFEMTLGWEEGGGISDQVIIARKEARFLKVWLESYIDYRSGSWFYNGGDLPTMLLKKRLYLVHREKNWLAEYKTTIKLIYYHNDQTNVEMPLRHTSSNSPLVTTSYQPVGYSHVPSFIQRD